MLLFFHSNLAPINYVANGCDIWSQNSKRTLSSAFQQLYHIKYSAFPTNSHLAERGVKESGFVTLKKRNQTNRSLFSTARSRLIPDAMKSGEEMLGEKHQDTEKK